MSIMCQYLSKEITQKSIFEVYIFILEPEPILSLKSKAYILVESTGISHSSQLRLFHTYIEPCLY